MSVEVNCFSCLEPNATHVFGPNLYCNKCIQTFVAMERFMLEEIEKFKKEQNIMEEDNG